MPGRRSICLLGAEIRMISYVWSSCFCVATDLHVDEHHVERSILNAGLPPRRRLRQWWHEPTLACVPPAQIPRRCLCTIRAARRVRSDMCPSPSYGMPFLIECVAPVHLGCRVVWTWCRIIIMGAAVPQAHSTISHLWLQLKYKES